MNLSLGIESRRKPTDNLFGEERGSIRLADVTKVCVSETDARRFELWSKRELKRWFVAEEEKVALEWCERIEQARLQARNKKPTSPRRPTRVR